MPNVALVGKSTAGGLILGPGGKLTVGGFTASLVGDSVAGHGDVPHSAPTMVQGSVKMRVSGIPVVLNGHLASCGHTAAADSKMSCSS